jgi:16S rRNA (adenine1518-N6/adenine1519-N6)-dimethyltransferase
MRARKRFGQHFLEPTWVEKVIGAIDPRADETFIEIGPGAGALTRPLAARAKAVIAYEIDRDLARALRAASIPRLTVVEGDFLKLRTGNREPRAGNPIRVAGNLPYNVASPILFRLAELYGSGAPIVDATVMLQREVAERLTARPGTGEYGVLSVLLQHVADAELLLKLPGGAFRPAPKVESALVRLRFHAPRPPVADREVFAGLVQAVFTRRRKTLANALKAYQRGREPENGWGRESTGREPAGNRLPTPLPAGLDGRRRPETLTIAEFAQLGDSYAAR